MKLATAPLLLLLLPFPQTLPDGKTLLDQSKDAFLKFRSYQYEMNMTTEMTAQDDPAKMTVSTTTMTTAVSAINPDKKRVETTSQPAGTMIVSDGQYTWTYIAPSNRYTKKAAIDWPQSSLASMGLGSASDVEKMFKEVKTVGEEALEVDGKKIDCWVVELKLDRLPFPQQPGIDLSNFVERCWIAKDQKICFKLTVSGIMSGGQIPAPTRLQETVTLHSVKLNVDLPESLFRFTPPGGATEVEKLSSSPDTKPELVGKPAPALRVQSLDGKAYDLSQLKGKVVLLHFWTTWCEPCRAEMTELDKLQKEHSADGFVLLGVDVGEGRGIVEKYLKSSGVTHPIAVANDANLFSAYQVRAFPTHVLIGRDGVVVDYQIGNEGPAALRSLLAKAGLKSGEKKDR
jgi:thiol-disulfide isomerase/thioredoxin